MRRSAEPDPVKTRNGVIGCVAVVVVLALIGAACSHSGDGDKGSTSAAAPTKPDPCYDPTDKTVYDGKLLGCFPGGELVTVAKVVTGDSFQLKDGRTVVLAGVHAPASGACAASGAIDHAKTQVEGQPVNMVTSPDGIDTQGRPRVYLQYNSLPPVNFADDGRPIGLDHDLGFEMASEGWADTSAGPNNPAYLASIQEQVATAKEFHHGQWGPPCGPDWPILPDNNSAPDSSTTSPHVDVDVHHDHRNLPDGTLTGGFCRHHRWC